MAPQLATTRLRKEFLNLKKDPPPDVIAEPKESDILVWHYAVRGPKDTPYEGGIYVGKLKFHSDYPLKGPSIYMLTPSGRFKCNTKICMSMSDFHPESWNPMWTVSTIIQGVQSFMASDELTTGGLRATEVDRKKFASVSMAYNTKMFLPLFDGDIAAAFTEADEARKVADENKVVVESGAATSRRRRNRRRSDEASTRKEENIEENIATEETEGQTELTEEEIEKRRIKNAKKRARQKAKKAVAVGTAVDKVESAENIEEKVENMTIDDA